MWTTSQKHYWLILKFSGYKQCNVHVFPCILLWYFNRTVLKMQSFFNSIKDLYSRIPLYKSLILYILKIGIYCTCVKHTASLSLILQFSHENTSIGITLNVFVIFFTLFNSFTFFHFAFQLRFLFGILCLSYFLLQCVLYILIY